MAYESDRLPPPLKASRMNGRRNAAPDRPAGVKYPTAEAALEVLGKPHFRWTYSVPWSNEMTWVMRYDRPDGPKRYKVITRYRNNWYVGWPQAPYRLYRQNLLKSDTIYVCEGEQAALLCAQIGFDATTSMGGPFRAALTDWSPLEDKHVVILRDFDESGLKYAQDVARLAFELGAHSVKIVTLPGLEEGQDLYEWVDRFDEETPEEVVKIEIEKLVAEVEPITRGSLEEANMEITEAGSKCLSTIESAPIRWILEGMIPRRAVTMIQGEAGIGKSLLALDIAARASRGESRLDDPESSEPTGTVLFLGECDLQTVVRPRLQQALADLSLIFALQCQTKSVEHDEISLPVELFEQHLRRLESELARLKSASIPVGLVVIDCVDSFTGRDRSVDRGLLLARLTALAVQNDLAVVLIGNGSHRRLGPGRPAKIDTIAGDAAAGSIWTLFPDVAPNRRLLLPAKMNFRECPPGRSYSLQHGSVEWQPELVHTTAHELLAQTKEGPPRTTRKSVLNEVSEWLKEQLKDGPVPSRELYQRAKDDEISVATLRRAIIAMGCISTKLPEGGHFSVELPTIAAAPAINS